MRSSVHNTFCLRIAAKNKDEGWGEGQSIRLSRVVPNPRLFIGERRKSERRLFFFRSASIPHPSIHAPILDKKRDMVNKKEGKDDKRKKRRAEKG